MKRIVVSLMKCVQPDLCQQNSKSANSFELWGIDFMIDEQYKPWLIEVGFIQQQRQQQQAQLGRSLQTFSITSVEV